MSFLSLGAMESSGRATSSSPSSSNFSSASLLGSLPPVSSAIMAYSFLQWGVAWRFQSSRWESTLRGGRSAGNVWGALAALGDDSTAGAEGIGRRYPLVLKEGTRI